jgi:hypothetical protein|tara:strand:- start:572 stop:781 length:210 start_codon:yes stop_codon:yes gene_type:complete
MERVMKKNIVIPCQECEGEGVLADRHPNDPSCQSIECHVCGGEGEEEFLADYNNEQEALEDYPEMLRCE